MPPTFQMSRILKPSQGADMDGLKAVKIDEKRNPFEHWTS
jgi:hypothetical protein